MKNTKTKILIFLMFIPLIIYGQETEPDCSEEIPIGIYNLRMSLIKKQKLDVWPSLVEIKNLAELNEKRNDSLILFIAETDNGDKLRMTNTSDLSKFAEMDYNNDCRQEGTISTDLKFGKINLTEMKAEIYCRKEKYAELKIKN